MLYTDRRYQPLLQKTKFSNDAVHRASCVPYAATEFVVFVGLCTALVMICVGLLSVTVAYYGFRVVRASQKYV